MPGGLKTVVSEGFVALLYENGAFARTLKPGAYSFGGGFWGDDVVRTVKHVDMRERSITIKGQEILTADKVAIRVSLLVYFRVIDAAAALHKVGSYEDRIYEDVQLAARRFLASRSLDAILTDRNEISDAVRDALMTSASVYGVEIVRADVKDLVFPGNLREIMNQVLETERRAEAKLIQARKDVEATQIRNAADGAALRDKLTTEQDTRRMRAEIELQAAQSKLRSDIEAAQALLANPMLLRLRELETLSAMARAGAKFTVGLSGDAFRAVLSEPIEQDPPVEEP